MKRALKNKRLVISLGGSLLVPELPPKIENFMEYAYLIIDIYRQGHNVLAVCGGGELAREYQKLLPKHDKGRDWVGIEATKLNATTLNSFLGSLGAPYVPSYTLVCNFYERKIVCVGGDKPGHSTDWDAAWFAKQLSADLVINATNVNGIYTKDPHKFKDAKLIPELTYEEYLQKFGKTWTPGMHAPFDFEAAKLMAYSRPPRVPTVIVNGKDLDNILKAIDGQRVGTLLR